MINILRRDIQVPVVITHDNKHCDIYVPDFDITVHGHDYVDAISNAIMKVSAIYYYNIERNVQFEFKTTYAMAENISKRIKGSFATYIALTA